ncbi:MAG: hypothetical protein U9Q81_14500 [Pseudomonadota bacterium]|nr:hypothetical protein [Pseudomonadota bacterium]
MRFAAAMSLPLTGVLSLRRDGALLSPEGQGRRGALRDFQGDAL